MLEALSKVFADLKLSADVWFIILMLVVVAAFVVTLVVGLVAGKLKSVKSAMRAAVANPNAVVGAMKKMPADIKGQYRTARMTNTKPSVLITEQVCVDEPYKSSLVSKVWLVTLVATLICAAIAFLMIPMATAVEAMNALGGAAEEAVEALAEGAEEVEEIAAAAETAYAAVFGGYVGPTVLLVLGGILTLVGGLIGKVVRSGSAKLYVKFVPAMDGEAGGAQPQMQQQQMNAQYNEAPVYGAEAQEAPMYAAEPQDTPVYAAEPQETPMYSAEPQADYGAPTQEPVYEQAAPVVNEQQESDEEIRRRAREEALAQARAQQQAAQAQAQAQAQAAQQQRAQAAGGSSVDDVIAKINDIEANGASRETMREVATQLQKERAKPENKTPDTQKRLNEALSKLLKAMSAATKK